MSDEKPSKSEKRARQQAEAAARFRERNPELARERVRIASKKGYDRITAEEPWRKVTLFKRRNWNRRIQTLARREGMTRDEYLAANGLVWELTEDYMLAVVEEEQAKAAWLAQQSGEARQVQVDDLFLTTHDAPTDPSDGRAAEDD